MNRFFYVLRDPDSRLVASVHATPSANDLELDGERALELVEYDPNWQTPKVGEVFSTSAESIADTRAERDALCRFVAERRPS